jgi:hypothetical protein
VFPLCFQAGACRGCRAELDSGPLCMTPEVFFAMHADYYYYCYCSYLLLASCAMHVICYIDAVFDFNKCFAC